MNKNDKTLIECTAMLEIIVEEEKVMSKALETHKKFDKVLYALLNYRDKKLAEIKETVEKIRKESNFGTK